MRKEPPGLAVGSRAAGLAAGGRLAAAGAAAPPPVAAGEAPGDGHGEAPERAVVSDPALVAVRNAAFVAPGNAVNLPGPRRFRSALNAHVAPGCCLAGRASRFADPHGCVACHPPSTTGP